MYGSVTTVRNTRVPRVGELQGRWQKVNGQNCIAAYTLNAIRMPPTFVKLAIKSYLLFSPVFSFLPIQKLIRTVPPKRA